VNKTGGIQTDDGRTLFGLDAEIYLKLKAKEDPDWERKIGAWIEKASFLLCVTAFPFNCILAFHALSPVFPCTVFCF
jgi:hypothetical protein